MGISVNFWPGFFQEGAFLRNPSDPLKTHLWRGPFDQSSETHDLSIGCMDFFDSSITFLKSREDEIVLETAEVVHHLKEFQKNIGQVNCPLSLLRGRDFINKGYTAFENVIGELLEKIQKNEIKKALPVILWSARAKTIQDTVQWMVKSLQSPKEVYPFGYWNNEGGLLGATPEFLFSRKRKNLLAMALAGTLPRLNNYEGLSLLEDPKELHEHQLVVEDVQKQLSQWGLVKKTPTAILKLTQLFHLQTFLETELDSSSISLQELITGLHPTPALGVFPRSYGYQWLLETSTDQQLRGRFGAPIVFRFSTEKEERVEDLALVAIRSVFWNRETCFIGTGCGVVKDSHPEKEWHELEKKFLSTLFTLGIEL